MEVTIDGHKVTVMQDSAVYVAFDDYSVVYGVGDTSEEAILDYKESLKEYIDTGTSIVDKNTQQLPRCVKCGAEIDTVLSENFEYYCSACFNLNIDTIINGAERSKGLYVK